MIYFNQKLAKLSRMSDPSDVPAGCNSAATVTCIYCRDACRDVLFVVLIKEIEDGIVRPGYVCEF